MYRFSKNCVHLTAYVRGLLAACNHLLDPGDQLGLELGGEITTEHQEAAEGDDLGTHQVGTGVLDDLSDLVSGGLIAIHQQSHVSGLGLVQTGAETADLVRQFTLDGEAQNHDTLLVAGILGGEFSAGRIDGQLVLFSNYLCELSHAFFLGIVQNTHLDKSHYENLLIRCSAFGAHIRY